jgi:hypothetical protein
MIAADVASGPNAPCSSGKIPFATADRRWHHGVRCPVSRCALCGWFHLVIPPRSEQRRLVRERDAPS